MKSLRRKRPPAPARRIRPESLDAQIHDVRGYMAARAAEAMTDAERGYWTSTDRANLVLVRDYYGPSVWPDDPDVHAERAEDVAVLDDYRAMLG